MRIGDTEILRVLAIWDRSCEQQRTQQRQVRKSTKLEVARTGWKGDATDRNCPRARAAAVESREASR